MKKKVLAILLALAMIFTVSITAFAEDGATGSAAGAAASAGEQPGTPPDGQPGEAPPNGGQGGTPPDGAPAGGPGGSGSSSVAYSGATSITAADTQSDMTYASTAADENALLVDTSDDVTIANPTVTKSGDSDGGDNCNFYGINSGIMVKGGGTTTITGGTVETTAEGANGVFSYGGNGGRNGAAGDGTTVVIKDTVINTTGNNAGGIMTTGGGITQAENLTITTAGRSSAAIRTDRGGGTVTVTGGSYTTSGLGSPAIYSTADITVSDAELVSNLSEGVCIEGKNSITLNNSNLTANNTSMNGNATFLDTIMMYQSMSGDADSGTSSFTMNGGTLTSKSGHVFHVTNTNAIINLAGVTINNEDSADVLLSVCDDGWSGSANIATLNADGQILTGTILVGDNSTLTLALSNASGFTGTIGGEITNAKGASVSTEVGTVSVTLDATSKWSLTADTYITEFNGDAANVINNGYTLYVNGVALEGTSDTGEMPTAAAQSDNTADTAAATTDTAAEPAAATTENKPVVYAVIGAAALALAAAVVAVAVKKKNGKGAAAPAPTENGDKGEN